MHPANAPFFGDRPDFCARLAAAPDLYRIERARSGAAVAVRAADGRWFGSRYDPAKEAERWATAQTIEPNDLPVLFGFAPALVAAIRHRPMVVVERDASLLKTYLAAVDFASSLEGVTIVLDDDGFRMMSAIRNAHDPFRHFRVRVLTSPFEEDATWIRRLAESALNIQREISLNAMSYAHHFPMWMKTVRENIEPWAESRDASSLAGALAGGAAVIVGAGPSLDRNIADLELCRDRALVIAVDTALRKLDAAGIVPDIAVAVDANKSNARDVDSLGSATLGAMLFADQVASPEIIRVFTGPKVFLRTINFSYDLEERPVRMMMPLDRLMAEIAGRDDVPSWQSGGSVSTNAFSLAQWLGISRVIFVGQDLAYTAGRSHSRGVGYEDAQALGGSRFHGREMLNRLFTSNGDVVADGWDGGKVRTSTVMREYLHWFNMTMERGYGRSFAEVIDATEGGARKKGMKRMTLREAAKTLGPAVKPAEKIRAILAASEPAVRDGWRDRMRRISEEAARLAETPERIEAELPVARWIALPAYIGGAGLPEPDHRELLLAALRASAEYIAKVWG